MCIDSLIAINSLSLAAFPVYGNAMNKGKAAKLKLFIESVVQKIIKKHIKPSNYKLQKAITVTKLYTWDESEHVRGRSRVWKEGGHLSEKQLKTKKTC